MKVLFVLPEFGPEVRGGIARFYEHAVSGLRSAGYHVDVCVASLDNGDAQTNDVPVRRPKRESIIAAEQKLLHLLLFPAVRNQLALAFAAYHECSAGEGYDVVETTDWGLLYVPWLANASHRPPVVVQLHGSPGQIGYKDPLTEEEPSALLIRALETIYLPRADELQTSGLSNALDWESLVAKKVRRILPAWPAPPNISRMRNPNAFGVVAARLQSWKGPELLCKACRELGEESPTVLWVGGDHPFQNLDQSMSSYLTKTHPDVWGKKIIPLGSQPQEMTRSIQDEARFIVHPSSWDVFGLAVVEAMAAAKVVICSDQAGASCLIEHEKNGFVYPGKDSHRLAELLRKVSNLDSDTLTRIGSAARNTIGHDLDVQKITRMRLAAYAELRPRRDDLGHPWMEKVFAPEHLGRIPEEVLLDKMPLKRLIGYMGKRIRRRYLRSQSKVTATRSLAPREVSALLERLTELRRD